jgi:hypothetical protein
MTRLAQAAAVALAVVVIAGGCTDYVGDDLRAGDYPRRDAIVFDELTALANSEEPPPPPEPVDSRSLEAGDCFDDLDQTPLRAFGRGQQVGRTPCEHPHRYEVFARPLLGDPAADPWPGDAQAEERADRACVDAFEAFVGTPWAESTLDYLVLAPRESDWIEGEGRAWCAVFDLGLTPLVGTAAASER